VAAARQTLDEAKVMAGVLALLIAEREDHLNASDAKYTPAKTEVVLAGAGLTAPEVAALVGKNLAGVRKTIQRGQK
jgi:hypothetical protein